MYIYPKNNFIKIVAKGATKQNDLPKYMGRNKLSGNWA